MKKKKKKHLKNLNIHEVRATYIIVDTIYFCAIKATAIIY